MKKLFALAAIVALTGCTAVAQQAVTGYEATLVERVKAADDQAIKTWSTAACATPYSAAIRNTAIIPALKALCLPAGSNSNPDGLLPTAAPLTAK